MPAYKDDKRNTWYCQFYYEDWQGNRKKKQKRGFKTKKEALEWESNFKLFANANMDMTLGAHVIPYFGNKPMTSITPSDIIQWQNEIRAKEFKPTYLRMIQNQITALFTHASRIYNLANNPCRKVKRMGKSEADKLDFWTKEEYDEFIGDIEVGSRYYVLFEVLFWTGARLGETLALCKSDIYWETNKISISKTYYRTDRRDIITTPKTEQSVRVIDIPQFLTKELREYVDKLYGLPDDARIFPIVEEAVQHKLKRQCEKTGVKKIRVHDIRHSHVAYLIHQGVQPLIIKERLGHKDIKITLNTYGHLYPNQQRAVADMLNQKRNEESPDSGNCQDLR